MFSLAISTLLIIFLFLYLTRNYDYWKKRGVKFVKPVLLFGNNLDNYLMRKSICQSYVDCYRQYPEEKVVGFFQTTSPVLVVRDPQLIKRVLVTDFGHFHHRGVHPDKDGIEPIMQNSFFADGDLWRLLRQYTKPAFTSGKLKRMFPLIVDRVEQLQSRLLIAAREEREIDARDLMARFTTDFIGACGFGLDAGSLNEENSAFRKLGDKIFEFGVLDGVIALLKGTFPLLFRNLKYLFKVEKQIVSLVNKIQKERNYQPSDRNDFVDLLLAARQKGVIEVESLEKFKPDGNPEHVTLEFNDKLIAAQVFVFFAAGFETSSNVSSFTLNQIAYNNKVQNKIHQEIDAVLDRHDNKLTYDAINEMIYLNWTFKEGMRLFPPAGHLTRKCTKKYNFPDLDFSIDEGVIVSIPVQALHTDPQYFDEPLEFRPERFNPENTSARNKYTYLPFGDGPRACIGSRLGMMQSLAGLAAILSKFTVKPSPKSKRNLPVEANVDFVQRIKGEIPLLFVERKHNV